VEVGPAPRAGGHWTLESVLCDGVPVGNAQGRTVVTLGEADPVVRNAGPGTAYDVVAPEVDPHSDEALALHTTKGDCRGTRPARCAVGTPRKGQRATIAVDVPATRLGRTRNRVAVTSSTSDPDLSNNRAGPLVSVLPPLSPRFTG
jgi:hypothetical protein